MTELVEEKETLAEYVRRLEEAASAPPTPNLSGESIAAEVERFLREIDQEGREET